MKNRRFAVMLITAVMLMQFIGITVLGAEYVSIRETALLNGYEYFEFPEKDTVNLRNTSYILAFQNGSNQISYETALQDQGSVTLRTQVIKKNGELYISRVDAETVLTKYFARVPEKSMVSNDIVGEIAVSPVYSEMPMPTRIPRPETTATPTAMQKPTPTATPTAKPEPETTAISTAMPEPTSLKKKSEIYAVRNGTGSCILVSCRENKKFTTEKMTDSNGCKVSLVNIDDYSYLPFRYIFEKLGFCDVTGYIRGNRRESFAWSATGNNNLRISIISASGKKLELETDKPIEDLPNICRMKNINGVTYVPLQMLRLLDIFVQYNQSTDTIYISREYNEDNIPEVEDNLYYSIYCCNYGMYSDLYKTNNSDEPKSVKLHDETVYCVSQYGSLLLCVDSEFKVWTAEIDSSGSIINASPLEFEGMDSFFVDRVIFDGKKIYGIKTVRQGDYAGQLFSAELMTDSNGQYYADSYCEYPGADNVRNAVLINGTGYIYYIDKNDSEKIKRVRADVNRAYYESPEVLSDANGDIKFVSYFCIGLNGQVMYATYTGIDDSRKTDITIADCDSEGTFLTTAYSEQMSGDIHGINIIHPKSDAIFCFIADNSEGGFDITIWQCRPWGVDRYVTRYKDKYWGLSVCPKLYAKNTAGEYKHLMLNYTQDLEIKEKGEL